MPENKFNTPEMLARCVPMSRLQSVLGGKWKIMILWYVTAYRVQRFGELQRRLDGVTQSSLTKSLRELERDGFLHREVYQEIPPPGGIHTDGHGSELRPHPPPDAGLERGPSAAGAAER